jgi:hypothetical protein
MSGQPVASSRSRSAGVLGTVVAALLSACGSAGTEATPGTGGSGRGTGGAPAAIDAQRGAPDSSVTDAPSDLATLGTGGSAVPATGGGVTTGTGGHTTSTSGGATGQAGSPSFDAPPPASGGVGGGVDASLGGRDAPSAGGAGGNVDVSAGEGPGGTGGTDDSCNPPPPNGYHTIHFRYPWAGQKTLTLFPKLLPESVELEIPLLCNSMRCSREQNRPWFNCPVPDAYFVPDAEWIVSDTTHALEWSTVAPRPMPTTPGEYWLRWHYGKPDIPRTQDPPNFEWLDYYPDAAYGDWAGTGQWDDAMCAAKPPATPVTVGFGGWFPYRRTDHQYPHGGSLAAVYPDPTKAQDALDAFVFQRYQLWKQNWVRYDADACGAGTARVHSDLPLGTVSEGQGYGIAMSAAVGDKELFAKLWGFVRRYRSYEKYCGLMGWMWKSPADCQAPDTFAPTGGNHESAFDADADIGIGLVYAASQWPEYAAAATDWLVRMECEVNTQYGDGWNYPTNGESWDKSCSSPTACNYPPGTASQLFNDYYPPGYFRVFGDFLAKQLGADAKAANGQSHRDFWYKTAETVYELVERCYDEPGVHPGLIGNGGDILRPCRDVGGGEPYEWARAFWRLGIDAAWFGNNTSLSENAPGSSRHFPGKSRMQAKLDNTQGFYADFHKKNPPEPDANRFSSICHHLTPAGTVSNCDPAYGHNSYTVNMAMCAFVSRFDNGGATSAGIRLEALEEALTTSVMNEHYFEESLGVYSLLFLTGNFPNPLSVPAK